MLALCNLSTLDGRSLRDDLIQVFKLLKGLDQINWNNFFVLDVNTSRRGHTLKVANPRMRIDIRYHSFSHKVINCLNNLPVEIVESQSITNFKYKPGLFLSTQHDLKKAQTVDSRSNLFNYVSFFHIMSSLSDERWLPVNPVKTHLPTRRNDIHVYTGHD